VEAQIEYADSIHDNSGVNQYAQKLISTPGKQDGLAWRNPDGSWGGPVGEGVVQALEAGYVDKTKPFHGYYFKVLKGQGPDAVLGRLDYVIGGAMIGGFCARGGAGQLPRHRRQDIHGQLRRARTRERPRAGFSQHR
jgi:hypothetical protein